MFVKDEFICGEYAVTSTFSSIQILEQYRHERKQAYLLHAFLGTSKDMVARLLSYAIISLLPWSKT